MPSLQGLPADMALNAITIAAIVAACWAHPSGQAYLAKIDQIEQLSISCGNPCCNKTSSRAHKQEKHEYVSISWNMDWTQPIIEKVEKELPKDVVEPLKKIRNEAKPSNYLNNLLRALEFYAQQIEDSITSFEDVEEKLNKLEKLSKLEDRFEKFVHTQMFHEDEELHIIYLAYKKFYL